MARTRGSKESSKHKTSHSRSLRDQLLRKRGGSWAGTEGASPAPQSPQEVLMGMENTPSPSFSITLFVFGFLKSLDLNLVGLNPDMISSVNLITGWEIVVYDPVMAESRLGRDKPESVGQSKDFGVENVVENLSFNEFVVEDTEDSDEDELILRFKRTILTMSQTATKLTLKR